MAMCAYQRGTKQGARMSSGAFFEPDKSGKKPDSARNEKSVESHISCKCNFTSNVVSIRVSHSKHHFVFALKDLKFKKTTRDSSTTCFLHLRTSSSKKILQNATNAVQT